MAKLTAKERARIINTVNSYNNSPWIELGSPYNLEKTLKRAETEGVEVILQQINRADIALFHAEEGLCGNI